MLVDRNSLMLMARSGDWPLSVPPQQVVPDQDEAKMARARDVLDQLVVLKEGQSILDYGCGEGHMVAEATRRGNIATGYDPIWQQWDRHGDAQLLTRQEGLNGRLYDRVLLYDVLDHAARDQHQILTQITQLLSPDGKIMMRLHPFVSIHGTHLYSSLNLAWVHLLLDDNDIRELGGNPQKVIRVTRPIDTYRGWFRGAGLKVVREDIVRTQIPPMFHDPDILMVIAQNCYKAGLAGGAKVGTKEVLHGFLSVQFVDYELTVG